MTLEIVKGELIAQQYKTRPTDLARVTIQIHSGPHDVVVHWAGLSKSRLSPIEETLPPRIMEDIEALRELQRGVLRHSLEGAFSDDRATRLQARELIEFYTRELRTPLTCTPIRLDNAFSVWAPSQMNGSQTAIELGRIIDIDVT